jgi:hypothetical protein
MVLQLEIRMHFKESFSSKLINTPQTGMFVGVREDVRNAARLILLLKEVDTAPVRLRR